MPDPVADPTSDPPLTPDPASTPPATPPADPDPFDKDRAMATIHKLREENKAARQEAKKAADLEARLKEIEEAQLSEQEKTAKERDALLAERDAWTLERQATGLRLAVYSHATALGVVDADLALAALDRTALEYAPDGTPTNVEAVLKTLLEAKPILRGSASLPQPAGDLNAGGGSQGGKTPQLTAEQLDAARNLGMSVEAYAAMQTVTTYDEYVRAREQLKTAS